jgi:hypothetical protein
MAINLRKSTNFITAILSKDIADTYNTDGSIQPRNGNVAWPSEASAKIGNYSVGECRRSMYYKITGIQPTEPMSVVGKSICDAGNMYEAYFINKLKKYGMLKETQQKINFLIPNSRNNVHIHGRMDCIIEHDGMKDTIELKSVGEFKAAKIMNSESALPSPSNLMQVMLYKYYLENTESGKALDISNVYLVYINRSTGSTFYYKVDLDQEGWPVLTAYDQAGKELYTVKLKDVNSLQDLENTTGISTSDAARLAELKINIKDIFESLDSTFDYVTNKKLPDRDYSLVYTKTQADREHKIGRLSKIKLNRIAKGEVYGDEKCQYCMYKTKCMQDSGIVLK